MYKSRFHGAIFPHRLTLDDVVPEAAAGLGAICIAGSRADSKSLTAGSVTSGSAPTEDPGYQRVLDAGYDKFTMPLYGGFDGFDVVQQEPIINNKIFSYNADQSTDRRTDRLSYEYYTLKRALDAVSDPETVDMNMLMVPGLWDDKITDHVLNICQTRADSLGIIETH